MSWRTVAISSRAKLDLRMSFLVVRTDSLLKIHLSEISVLIIESTAVSITAALLCELIQRKVLVVFCDEKRNPTSLLQGLYGSHDCSGKLRSQLQWHDEAKSSIWTRLVAEKIHRQRLVLLKNGLRDEYDVLTKYLDELEENDKTNREAHAARVYFNALFGPFFSRGQDRVINGALDYGYAIILSLVNREVVACGFNTQLGIFHNSRTNPFNLSSDIMEPLRPILDQHLLEKEFKKEQELDHDAKMRIVSVLDKVVKLDGKKQTLLNAVKIYTQSVLRSLETCDYNQIRFIEDELSIYESNSIL